MMDNDAVKKQLEFLNGGFKLLCQREVQFLEMLTSMEETLKRMVCAVERIESRSISDDSRQLDLPIFTKAKSWFHKELSWIPFNSWSQVKDGLLLTFGNNRDKKRVLMELDLEMKQWIKDFDRKMEPYKFLESEAIVDTELSGGGALIDKDSPIQEITQVQRRN
ncbi:unnamed protein product [Arabidopsis thaliana]|uniref:Uncharacterized protein n=1 Tax=Arabidopsis thaliana TaxID=3702 RepID=A0A5S9WJB7_ARATH|nr:unnamed protein product [Arabidopsis thaliana]